MIKGYVCRKCHNILAPEDAVAIEVQNKKPGFFQFSTVQVCRTCYELLKNLTLSERQQAIEQEHKA